MVLLFVGPAGSGKDTQAEILAESNKFTVLSTGQISRDDVQTGSERGKKIKEFINSGKLIPDDLIYEILGERLKQTENKNIILTGVVRSFVQIEMLDKVLRSEGLKLDNVVYFKLSDEAAIQRIANRVMNILDGKIYHMIFNPPPKDIDQKNLVVRDDDKPEAIKVRLDLFHKNYDKILEEYKKRGILIEIDASKSIEEIANEVKNKLAII